MATYDYEGTDVNSTYDVDGSPVVGLYDYQGAPLVEVDYSSYSVSDYATASISQMQGFDIYNGTIFQFRANSSTVNNTMATIDVATGTLTNNITAVSDHGDSASFSKEFYDPSDEFPLLYVTADVSPAVVYVDRVTKTSCSLVKTLVFPADKTGYAAALALDEKNGIAYMLGYKEHDAYSDDGGANTTIVSLFDMNDLTDNGDNTFTPAFLSSYERPFIYVMQGLQFHDGLIWIASGYYAKWGYIYALDPADGTILYTIPTKTQAELEGIAWLSANEMVFGVAGATYKKVTFEVIQ